MPLNAKDLMTEMVSHKADWRDHWHKYIPIMKQYTKNHDIRQIRQIMSGGDKKLYDSLDGIQFDDIYRRVGSMRTLLSVVIPNITSMICVTFQTDSYNFAYVYFVIDSDAIKPLFFSLGENLVSVDGEWRSNMADIGSYELLIGRYAKHIELIWDTLPKKRIITTHMFYSHGLSENIDIKFKNYIDEQQYGIRLFALSWFGGKFGTLQTHTSSEFIDLLDGDIPDIPDEDARDMFTLLGSICGCVYMDHKLPASYTIVRTGQKLILLSPDEVSHPLNENFSAWNEVLTSRKTTDLILNMITPCFAIHSAWFFVYNVGKELFNVSTTRSGIEMSDTVRMTPPDLRHDIVLSNIAIGIINENTGSTFLNDTPVQNISRYIFDIIYALYCMNTKLGKIHGDLHGNNVVINHRHICDGYIIYAIGKDEYIFPHTGSYSCIIDFSRSVNIDHVKIIEIAIQKYDIHFPKWMKVNCDIVMKKATDALDNGYESFVKIISAFDMYEFASSVLQSVDTDIYIELTDILTDIKSGAESILLCIIDDNQKNIEWANYVLINALFSPTKERPDMQNVWGYYSNNNDLVYSTNSYSDLPSLLSSAPMIANDDDEPVPSMGMLSAMIKLKYRLMESDESIIREVGL
jgi:hypothetical protein